MPKSGLEAIQSISQALDRISRRGDDINAQAEKSQCPNCGHPLDKEESKDNMQDSNHESSYDK